MNGMKSTDDRTFQSMTKSADRDAEGSRSLFSYCADIDRSIASIVQERIELIDMLDLADQQGRIY